MNLIAFQKQKNTLSHQETKRLKTLCGTTLGCRPLTEPTAQRLQSQADALTGIIRPHLLASSFSRRLQGDFRSPPLSALYQTAALFAGVKEILVPIYARTIQFLAYDITFGRFVNRFYEKRAPNGALLRVFSTY